MKKKTIILTTILDFMLLCIGVFMGCQKPENSTQRIPDDKLNNMQTTSVVQIPLAFKDSADNLVSITYSQLQNLYNNVGILPTRENELTSVEIINAIDDDGNEILGIRTNWAAPDGKYYSIASVVFEVTDSVGVTMNVLGYSFTNATTTSTCTCEGTCGNGCDASTTGTSFCSCSACFPNGTCKKTHTIVTTSDYHYYY